MASRQTHSQYNPLTHVSTDSKTTTAVAIQAVFLRIKMNEVAQPSSEVNAMRPDWDLAAALLGGTRSMRAAGTALLPKWPNEDVKAYQARLSTATLLPAYSRTVKTLTGKPFSKPLTIGDDVPAVIVPMLEDVDLEGRNIDVFAANLMEDALGYGLAGILVDFPETELPPPGSKPRTVEDEKILGIRPYWVHIKAKQILGWRPKRINGKWQVMQLRIMESVCEPDGPFSEKEVPQVRVLTPGIWETYRQNDKKDWVLFEQGATSLSYVPFVPVYGDRTGFMTAKPPLIEMAHLNVQHWQSQSDQQTILHVARVPILAVIGVEDDKWSMTVGASEAVKLPLNSSMMYVEHTGAAIEAGRSSLKDLEESMRQAGAELLLVNQTAQKTATEIAADNAVGMCALQRISQNLEDSLDAALQVTADWIKAGNGGHVEIFDDYAAATLADASAQLVLSAQQGGLITKATAIKELQRRGTLSGDIDSETEFDAVQAEGPALGLL